MTNMNISIKKEAYDYLRSLKARNKSFSNVIMEFKDKNWERGTTKDLLRFSGALKNFSIDWGDKERKMKKLKESFNRRLKKRMDNDRN